MKRRSRVEARRSSRLPPLITTGLTLAGLYRSILQPWFMRWGATPEEAYRVLPGDELVPNPVQMATRAITIAAPPRAVWPWIVQIGQGKAGLYSYERLENLIGCDIVNADSIMADYQRPQPGDLVRLGPEGYPFFVVERVEPVTAFLLRAGEASRPAATWLFYLDEGPNGRARLIVRMRWAKSQTRTEWLFNELVVPPIHFVMERQMLYGIKARAERHLADQPAPMPV